VRVTADATVHETWRFEVPADWTVPDLEETDVFTALHSDPEATLVGCENTVDNENNRSIDDIDEEALSEQAVEDASYRAAACRLYDGEKIDVDEDAVVSRGDDPGAYVAAWVWVSDEDVRARVGGETTTTVDLGEDGR
jgi:hypothetical protein